VVIWSCVIWPIYGHGRRQRGAGGRGSPWIFKHGTNIVDRGLKVLFFGLVLLFSVFFRCPPSLENFLPTPLFVVFQTHCDVIKLQEYQTWRHFGDVIKLRHQKYVIKMTSQIFSIFKPPYPSLAKSWLRPWFLRPCSYLFALA